MDWMVLAKSFGGEKGASIHSNNRIAKASRMSQWEWESALTADEADYIRHVLYADDAVLHSRFCPEGSREDGAPPSTA